MDEQQIYRLALEQWGKKAQVFMLFEEMAELQKVICESTRMNKTILKYDIIQEIIDVEIMLGQMKILFNITGTELRAAKANKLGKLRKLLDKHKEAKSETR